MKKNLLETVSNVDLLERLHLRISEAEHAVGAAAVDRDYEIANLKAELLRRLGS